MGLIIRLSPATGDGTGRAAPVAPASAPRVTVALPPPLLVALLPFATPLEGEGESSTAVEARTATPDVVVLADSSSSEVAIGDGDAEAVSKQSVTLDEAAPNHAVQLQVALAGPALALGRGPTLTWEDPWRPGKALFALDDVPEMASWGSALRHRC